jgi:hypothetical protein
VVRSFIIAGIVKKKDCLEWGNDVPWRDASLYRLQEEIMDLPSWGTVEWARKYNEDYGQTYTFEADGVSPCHLPSLVGPLDNESKDPEKDAALDWAGDFVNDNPADQRLMAPCSGSLEEMRQRARRWKQRFPEHKVVIYSRTCIDAQFRWEDNAIRDEFFVEEVEIPEVAPTSDYLAPSPNDRRRSPAEVAAKMAEERKRR